MQQRHLIDQLFELGAIQFGSYLLKSGIQSPIYLDLRLIISRPKLLTAIAETLHDALKEDFDLVCGVPYGAIPLATAFSIRYNIPMILLRKERKEHGTGKRIEGIFHKSQKCLVLEDVITSGQSLLETVPLLEQEGLAVKKIAILIDREQGGVKCLEKKGYSVCAVCTLTQIVHSLLEDQKIDAATAQKTFRFIQEHQIRE